MNIKVDLTRYSNAARVFHWAIAVIVILLLSFSFFLGDVPEKYQGQAYMIHKSLGLTVLFLAIFRVIWIHYIGRPPLPQAVPFWEKALSRIVQYSFYFLLIIMPLTGWIMSVAAERIPSYFGLFSLNLPIAPSKPLAEFMDQCHIYIAWILIALVVLHVLGALKHHFVDKDDVLRKML